jgi:hypothetical protein
MKKHKTKKTGRRAKKREKKIRSPKIAQYGIDKNTQKKQGRRNGCKGSNKKIGFGRK